MVSNGIRRRRAIAVTAALLSCSEAPTVALDGFDGVNVDVVRVVGASLLAAGFQPKDGSALLVVSRGRGAELVRIDAAGDTPAPIELSSSLDVVRAAPALGGWVVSGGFRDRFELPDHGAVHRSAGGYDAVLLRLDSAGRVVWSVHFAADGDTFLSGVAQDRFGNTYVLGRFAGTLTVGGRTLLSRGSDDAFVARFGFSGALEWLVPVQELGRVAVTALALSPIDSVLVAGSYDDLLEIGSETLAAPPSRRPFLAELDSEGRVRNARGFVTEGAAEIAYVASGPTHIWVLGTLTQTLTIDGITLRSRGQTDVFVLRFDHRLELAGARRYGGPVLDVVEGGYVDANGWLWLAGTTAGDSALASGRWSEGDGTDAFVAALTPSLTPRLTYRSGGRGDQSGGGVSVDRDGRLHFVTDENDVIFTSWWR